MSKLPPLVALMLVTGWDAYAIYTYRSTDPQFITAAYLSAAVAVIVVYLETIHLVARSVAGGISGWRQKRKPAASVSNDPIVITNPDANASPP